MAAVEHQGAARAEGDGKGLGIGLEPLRGGFHIVRAGPAAGFVPVAEQQIHAPAGHGAEFVPEMRHDAGVGQAERDPGAMLPGQFAGADGGGAATGRGGQVPFDVEIGGGGERFRIEVFRRQRFADPQKSIHRAFGIRRDQHQAFAGGARRESGDAVVRHSRRGQVVQIKMTVIVVGDPARVVTATTEAAHRDHGVGARAAARPACQGQMIAEYRQQLVLARFVDQGHDPFLDPVGVEFGVGNPQFGIHQGGAQAVNVETLHDRGARSVKAAIIHARARGPSDRRA